MKSHDKRQRHSHAQPEAEMPLRFQPRSVFSLTADSPELCPLISHIPLPIWLQPLNGDPCINTAMADYLGIDPIQPPIAKWLDFVHPDDWGKAAILWESALSSHQSFRVHCRFRHAQLGYRMCALQADFSSPAQTAFEWMVSFIDTHEHYEQRQLLDQRILNQSSMLDASLDCIKMLSTDGKVIYMNRSGCIALGVAPNEKQFGMRWLDLLPKDAEEAGKFALIQASQGHNARFPGKSELPGEATQYWDNILTPIMDESGVTQNILCVSRNTTQQIMAESKLQQVIEQDDLTGLLNRRAFNKLFRQRLQEAVEQRQLAGLLLIDLDYFKHVNDTLGHVAGDHLLHTLGLRYQRCFEAPVTVARLGGDEFAILVPNLQDEAQLLRIAEQAALQMALPITYAGQSMNSGMSIGCAVFPRDAQTSSNLLKCADIALNDLKSSGRGGIRMFNQTMFEVLEQTTQQLTLARSILKSDSIVPFYQPKVMLDSGQVIGFEALLRWYDLRGNLHLPSNIYAAFHDYELASGISEMMQNKIFADIQHWQASGLKLLPISINAAPVEFLRDDYAEKLLRRMDIYGIAHDALEVEITEQSLSERGANYVTRAVNILKFNGIKISLDDFGTGHSSLTRLLDYPIDCLKIDKSFVEHVTQDPSAFAIVNAISQLGNSIALDVLVEGIENAEQLEILKRCKCSKGQGFYFYKPLSSRDAVKLLQPE